MTPSINITTDNNCTVYVEDTSSYYPEDEIKDSTINQFKYSDTIAIDVIQYNKLPKKPISEESELKPIYGESVFSDHSEKSKIKLTVNSDGHISIVHIILPSKKWVENQLAKGFKLDSYDIVFFGDNGKVYKYLPKEEKYKDSSIGDIIDLNLDSGNYTVFRVKNDRISICYLYQCYINLCQQILNQSVYSRCWNKQSSDNELIYKRDLIWMSINVIQYLAEKNSEYNPTLGEVERIIEQITGCNGLCTNVNTISNGCGCSKV